MTNDPNADLRRAAAIAAASTTALVPFNLAMCARHGDVTSIKIAITAYTDALNILRPVIKGDKPVEVGF